VLSLMRWEPIPSWAKDISGSASMISARSETAVTKPAFRAPMKFATVWFLQMLYEWRLSGTADAAVLLEVKYGELFVGLWDDRKDSDRQCIKSCSTLTTTQTAITFQVHDRVPVILSKDD